MKNQAGFTVTELMMVIGIIGAISLIASPNISQFMQNRRVKAQLNDVLNSIILARTEAVKRKATVTMCRTADPFAATPVCGADGTNDQIWTTGWVVYEDEDGDGNYDTGDGDEIIIRGNPAYKYTGDVATAPLKVLTNNNANRNLQYNPDGTTNENGTAIFAVCDDRMEAGGRSLQVPLVGRVVVTNTLPIADCSP